MLILLYFGFYVKRTPPNLRINAECMWQNTCLGILHDSMECVCYFAFVGTEECPNQRGKLIKRPVYVK